MPVVPARLLLVAVHALLHDRPLAVVGHEEAVKVQVEAVLDGGTVDLRDKTARARQLGSVDADALAEQAQLVWRLPRMLSAAAAHVDAEFVGEWSQAALEGTDDAGCDAGRMPVHPHDGAERLEPEGVRQALQEFVAAVMVHDRLRDDGAERRHARRQPRRHTSAMQS
jgi:hypothetical protein